MFVVMPRCSSSFAQYADRWLWVPARASLGRDDVQWNTTLSHHPRDEPGLAARRLDVFFQEAVRFLPDISRPCIGPGPAFVVARAGRLASLVAVTALEVEIAVIATEPVDRDLLRAVARLDHAGSADARDAAVVLDARRHAALQPADRAADEVGRVVEAPGAATPVALAYQCA